jgi:hypothetical protein
MTKKMSAKDYAEKMNLSYRLIMSFQHFSGKPLACIDALANSNTLEDLLKLEGVLERTAQECLAIAKTHKDPEVQRALAKLGGSINHTLAMRF